MIPTEGATVADTVAESFVGRTRELALLAEAIEDAREARPRIVLIEGPAGIGKTALAGRALRDAGLTVIRASGDEHEATVTFALLDQLLRHVPRSGAGGPDVVPSDALALPDVTAGGARLIDLLGVAQADGPVALVVDDLHWCDAPSLHALVFALRRLGADRVVVLLVVRTEASAGLPRGLVELIASDIGVRVSLTGLGRNNLRELAVALGVGVLPHGALVRLTAHTRGNPLYARALLRELDPRALLSRAGTPLPAPESYASLVVTRLRGCASATARLVVAAAVLGNRCRLSEAALLAELDEPLSQLDEACASRLLRIVDGELGQELVFVHPLVRASVYHDLGAAERVRLHRRAADLSDDERVQLSHRVAGATGDDPHLAGELVAFATKELSAGLAAAPAAAEALRAAARVAGSTHERETNLLGALECLIAAGELGAAIQLAASLTGPEDTAAHRYIQGALSLHTGRIDDAERLLRSAWEMAGHDGDPSVAAAIASQLAVIHLRRANADEVVLWARRSLGAGGPRIPLGLSPTTVLAVGLAVGGRYREAADAIPPLPERGHDLEPSQLEWMLARGIVRLWSDDPDGAMRDLTTTLRTARHRGLLTTAVFALYHLSETEFRLGQWDDAVAHGELAVSMARDADQFGMLASVHGNAALPLACRGEWEAADEHVLAALAATAILPDATNIMWTHFARAVLAAARGDHDTVVEATDVIAASLGAGGDKPAIKSWRTLGAEALATLGETDRADRLLRPHVEGAQAGGLSLARAVASRARGIVEVARGRQEAAERHFELALIGTAVAPFERAQVELAYGALLRRQGRRRHADALLRAAAETFDSLGAAPYAQRAQRELSACGLTPAKRTPEARYQLTPQEQTVAYLVTKGLRNREVAAELVVSVKTIEYHLGNIYRKLQVSSRTQLAARMAGGDVPSTTGLPV